MVLSLQLQRRWILHFRESFSWWSFKVRFTRQLDDDSFRLPGASPKLRSLESVVIKAVVAELKDCINTKDLQHGRALHSQAIECGWDNNKYVANTLITMYSRCGSMDDARNTFNSMTNRDVVSWTALIVGYADNGHQTEALELFEIMDCAPNRVTFACLLKACASLVTDGKLDKEVCLEKGLDIHRRVTELGFDRGIAVASTLVDMYSKCGDMMRARRVFDRMTDRDVVSWTVLIMGFVENGEYLEALKLLANMDCTPNSVTFVAAVKACAALASDSTRERKKCLQRGVAIHREAKELGCDKDITLANTLIDMYRKCKDMELARETFNGMRQRSATSWTALILGYVENGEFHVALDVFNSMDCLPHKITFVAALKACTGLVSEADKETCLRRGRCVHKQAADHGFDKDIVVANTLVDMYGKCGDMVLAREAFDRMMQRNVISWTALVLGYVENGQCDVALSVFDSMDCTPNSVTFVAALKACGGSDMERGIALHRWARELGFDKDISVANTLIDMYSKCREMVLARDVFDGMSERNVVSWNVLILGYVENRQPCVALEMYNSIGVAPNKVTLVGALKACACTGGLETGRRIHDRVRELGLEQDKMVASCLVDFYGKCADTRAADEVFNQIQSPDSVCWNALIGVYSQRGDVPRVLSLVKRMQESAFHMNNVTMLLMLTACSHAGMVDEGQRLFDSMQRHGLSPSLEHYNCLVDMLGRANKLDDAVATIKKMPLKANSVTWKTLLGACRQWNNAETGKVAFDALASLKDTDEAAVSYVLMSDIYGSLGKLRWSGKCSSQ